MVFSKNLLSAAVAFSAVSPALGFHLSFWKGEQCASAEVGTDNIYFADPCHTIPAGTVSAIIKAETDEETADRVVAFYGTSGCTGQPVTTFNTGCTPVYISGQEVTSYVVLQAGSVAKARRQRRSSDLEQRSSDAWWVSHQEKARKDYNVSTAEAGGSLSPSWNPDSNPNKHGMVTTRWGQTWKWHQVALGVTFAIPIEEWDDNVHVQNNTFLAWGSDGLDPADIKSIEARQTPWDTACQTIISCGENIAGAVAANIGNGWAQAIAAAYRLKAQGNTFYDWIHGHPFSVAITITAGGTLAGYGLGRSQGGATAQDNDQLASCGSDSSQQTSMINAFLHAGAGDDNAATVQILLPNGHTVTISGEVVPETASPTIRCDA